MSETLHPRHWNTRLITFRLLFVAICISSFFEKLTVAVWRNKQEKFYALQASGETLKMHRWKCRTRTPSLNPYIGCLHRSDILNPFIQSPLNSLFEPCFNQISNPLTALLHWIGGPGVNSTLLFLLKKENKYFSFSNPKRVEFTPPLFSSSRLGAGAFSTKLCV